MKKIIMVLAVWLMSWVAALAGEDAGETLRFSLKQAQEYAVKFSTETRNSRIDVAMARKKIWETTASGLPQLNATLSYRDNLKIPTTLIPAKFLDPDAGEGEFIGLKFGTQHNATVDVTATQLVFNGSYIVALQASKVYLQLAENQQEKKEIDIRETVANTYHLVLLAEKNREILRSSLENLRQTWQETAAMHQAGFSEATAGRPAAAGGQRPGKHPGHDRAAGRNGLPAAQAADGRGPGPCRRAQRHPGLDPGRHGCRTAGAGRFRAHAPHRFPGAGDPGKVHGHAAEA